MKRYGLITGTFILGRHGKAASKRWPLIVCVSFASSQFWRYCNEFILKKYKKQPQVGHVNLNCTAAAPPSQPCGIQGSSQHPTQPRSDNSLQLACEAKLGIAPPSLFPVACLYRQFCVRTIFRSGQRSCSPRLVMCHSRRWSRRHP
jgi:hypothetical protein